MAMQKSVTLPSGVTTTYHRVTNIVTDYNAECTTATIFSYVSKDIREASPAAYVTFQSIALDGIPTGESRAWAYGLIEALPEWDGATEV